jgi:tetratricopeptide (TPR) repeat protein
MSRYILYLACLVTLLRLAGQTQPLSRQDSALVDKFLQEYEDQLNRGNLKEASRFLNETAFIYWEHNKYRQAIRYYEQSAGINEKIQNENGLAMIHNNLGMLYADIGDYERSYEYFQKTLAARRSENKKLGMISALVNMSVVLNNLQRYDESAQGLEEALTLAREMNDPIQMKSCYGMLSETYEKAGNIEKSIHYFNLYRTFHELVQREEVSALKTALWEEKLAGEMAEERASKTEEELEIKKVELREVQKEVERYNALIKQFDSVSHVYYESLSRKKLEYEVLQKANELNELKVQEKAKDIQIERNRRNLGFIVTGLMIHNRRDLLNQIV